jgi:hypothetical protein
MESYVKSERRFRLEYEQATLGPEKRTGLFPSGYETLWVNNHASKDIQADDEIAHDGKVYVVISREDSDDTNTAVPFTVSYERRDTPAVAEPDPEILDSISEAVN